MKPELHKIDITKKCPDCGASVIYIGRWQAEEGDHKWTEHVWRCHFYPGMCHGEIAINVEDYSYRDKSE